MFTSPSVPGIATGLAAAAIWGGAIAVTRFGVSGDTPLSPADIAMLRFAGPALLLLPVLRRAWPRLQQVPVHLLALLLLGGGAPFVILAGSGLGIAGAAEAGALLPGAMPICVAMFSRLLGERIGTAGLVGLAIIGASVATVVLPSFGAGSGDRGEGYALLLGAAALGAGYTIALRRSGLGPWEAAAFVSAGSVLTLGPPYAFVMEPGLIAASWEVIALQIGFQGMASGILAPVAFAATVQRLGASKAAAFGSLAPGAACLGGFVLLGEVPTAAAAMSILATGLGIALIAYPRTGST
ncbi:EamA family transporter [Sabulicella glaciei]|uniref:EamA family transporter n=1 Tax=Sabulicella glaciei TaxID=2984948 RepID=A0ABT3NPF1_9PROT|nr:EamA family transporter [Roseococcus sp. MDT2-1-1]MCW8084041.1 EamA family transporter [Roseococcus sp. MDT2-1-1]